MDSGGPAGHRGPGLQAGQMWILRSGHHPHKTIGKEKSKAQPTSSYGIQEDQQNSISGFKVSRRLVFCFPLCFFFFLPPSDTISPGVVKSPEQIQRGSTRLTTTEKLRQISLCYPIEHAFCLFDYFFIIFTSFILLVYFYISSFCLVFFILFLYLITLFDWYSLFFLSYYI